MEYSHEITGRDVDSIMAAGFAVYVRLHVVKFVVGFKWNGKSMWLRCAPYGYKEVGFAKRTVLAELAKK